MAAAFGNQAGEGGKSGPHSFLRPEVQPLSSPPGNRKLFWGRRQSETAMLGRAKATDGNVTLLSSNRGPTKEGDSIALAKTVK